MFKKEKADTYKFKTGDRITHVKCGTGTILGCFTFHPPNNLYSVHFDNGWCTSGVPEDDLSEFSFKIGDRVTVVSMRYGSYGKTGTIVRDAGHESIFDFVVYFDGSGAGAYVKEDLKLCKEEKQMTKSDLKTGMTVKFKNGTSGIILKDTEDGDIVSMNGIYRKLADWNEDLSHGKISNLNIDSIWGNDVPNGCLFFDGTRWSLKELKEGELMKSKKFMVKLCDGTKVWQTRDEF